MMPSPAERSLILDDQNPWPGLYAFNEAAERFFNGREDETAELRGLVLQAPLAVLYASHPLPGGDSWSVLAIESPATSANWTLDAFAICVTALP